MGHYLFNFSKKGATKGQSLREQAGELLNARMWGIGRRRRTAALYRPAIEF